MFTVYSKADKGKWWTVAIMMLAVKTGNILWCFNYCFPCKMTSRCRNCILITNTTQICVVVHLKGLSKVPGCRQNSPPTWLLSAGYFLTTLVHHLYEISMLVPQTSIRVRKQVTCHKTLAVFSDYIAYEDAFLKAWKWLMLVSRLRDLLYRTCSWGSNIITNLITM